MKKWIPFAFLAGAGGLAAWYFGRTSTTGKTSMADVLAGYLGGGGGSSAVVANPAPVYVQPGAVQAVTTGPVAAAAVPAAPGITLGPARATAPVPVAGYAPLPETATIQDALAQPALQADAGALASFQALTLLGYSPAANYRAAMGGG